ncbi:unnamed protein product [Urochloa decumbens]|uniref:Ubiquitin-like protease family profile domain-containing protein n=1 Tax=Urochloa decumbens TaxID=240449 RepID=A0ABC9ACT4_9POAL
MDGGLKIHDVVTKGRVKMSGIKRKQVDDVEDPVVGKLNKSGVARKICTRRKLSSTPESQHNIGANKAKESGQEQSGQQKQTCKGQRQVDDGSIPPSPFELKFQLPGGLRQIAYDKYRVIMANTGKQLQRVWLKLEQPKLLEITGAQLQCSFRDDAAIGCAVLSAVVRLLQQEETSMYKKHGSNEKHWRNFMPPEFSDMVLGSEELGITSEVRDMFLGQHMGSMVEYSRMIMVPSRGAGYWSLYMWDMKDMTVHVFDPVCTNNDPEVMWAVHGGFIKKIGKALNTCRDVLFTSWKVDFEDFPEEFFVIEENPSVSSDSGFYIVHYMRWFDDQNIIHPVSKRAAKHLRRTLPYELLMMRGNKGRIPEDVIVKVDLTKK